MPERFKNHIRKFTEISEEEFSEISTLFQVKKVKKKENLLVEGQICKHHYFVLEGCLRQFFINEKGQEQTTEFAIENWWITDTIAFEQQQPTKFYIQAVEDSEVLILEKSSQERLFTTHPSMERYFRLIFQRAYGAAQLRIKYLFSFSKEEFYHHFNQHYPAFVQRIPQYLLASFLGFSPEYLSEIRNKNRS